MQNQNAPDQNAPASSLTDSSLIDLPDMAGADGVIRLRPVQARLTPEFASAYAEAPAQSPSGGDFHDAFPLHDGSGDIGVVIGDVAGHGPEQTEQAEHMRGLLSNCLSVGLAPAEALTAVSAMIESDAYFDGYGTVFVGTLEAETGILRYASGGHEPGLIASAPDTAMGRVEQLEGTGSPAGALPPELTCFKEHETTIPVGATLLLYTDGVSEARPPHDRENWFGIERLKRELARLSSLSPRRLVSALLEHVSWFCHGQFNDDVAMMAIRRLK